MQTKAALVLLIMGCSCLSLLGDQVTLKNGDRLTGSIVSSDSKTLTLKSEYAGSVQITWDAVTEITSTQPLYLGSKGGQVIVGPVTTSDGKFSVETKESGIVTLPKDDVTSVRNKDEEAAHEAEIERLRHPGLADLWTGALDSGLALVRGNSESTTANFGLHAERATTRDKITLYTTSVFARSNVHGVNATTAQAINGGVRYDLNLSDRSFAFGTLDLFNDRFQDLDLRTVLGAGGGYHAVKNEKTTLDLMAGGAFNREFFTTFNRSSAEVLLGETLTRKFLPGTTFNETLFFYPNLSETGEFRGTLNAGLVTKLSKLLSWQLTFADYYLSNPVPGKKTNDLLLTTGIRLNFGKQAE
ncbi:MAG TPA: DUF481 domain-containing protein [Steroidobacteraceae bacterium]